MYYELGKFQNLVRYPYEIKVFLSKYVRYIFVVNLLIIVMLMVDLYSKQQVSQSLDHNGQKHRHLKIPEKTKREYNTNILVKIIVHF